MKTRTVLFFVLVALILSNSQVTSVTAAKWASEAEVLLDKRIYLPVVTAQMNLGGGNDVTPNLTGNEPHAAAVSPRNPNIVVIARFCTILFSTDFGLNFNTVQTGGCPVPASLQGSSTFSQGDPVLAFDSQDRLFWTYLMVTDNDNDGSFSAGDDRSIVVARIDNLAGSQPSNVLGPVVDVAPDSPPDNDDKPWIAVDANPSSPYADNVYVVWSRVQAGTDWDVLFSRSTDSGNTFSTPQVIASDMDMDWPSHVAVAPNGDVYASYHADECDRPNGTQNSDTAVLSRIIVFRDGNGGFDLVQGNPVQVSSFRAAISCNRQDQPGAIPQSISWMQGSNQPYVLPDPVRPGHIYVIANDDPNDNYGNGDDGDVVMARSTDYGETWTLSTVSHAPLGTLQVMPTGAIDQDGNLMVFWYDARRGQTNTAGNFLLDVYATVSRDGGLSFSNDFRINDAAFDPDLGAPCRFGPAANNCPTPVLPPGSPTTRRIGEYNGASAVNGIGYAAWTGNTATGQQTVFDVFSMLGAFPDHLEPNESTDFAVVAVLGSDDTYNVSGLTIHSATDIDFFKVVALHTGKLEVEIEFNERINDLDLRVRDRYGNVVANGLPDMTQTGSSLEILTIPVVQGEIYFVEVCDQNAAVCNPFSTGSFAPQSTYDLTIVNRPAPVPFELDLRAGSDTGEDDDDLTSDTTPTIQLRVDDVDFLADGILFSPTDDNNLTDDQPGFKVRIFDNGNPAGFAVPVPDQPGVYEFTFTSPLPDGPHSITARVVIVDLSDNPATGATDHFVGQGGESNSLMVTVNTTEPACSPGSPPDMLDSSDNAGINIDNITTIMSPAFDGVAGVNVTVYILANGEIVGTGQAGGDGSDLVPGNGLGAFEVTVEPLADGVYDITAVCESDAGVLSPPTPALQVTIAHYVLNLNGAAADVLVDLADGGFPGSPTTVTGYPGIPGGVAGISTIPVVNLDVNGHALTILGTDLDDTITFTPTGPQGGILTRVEAPQVLNLSAIGGLFNIDPGAGTDTLTVNGTVAADLIVATVDVMAAVQVNSLQNVITPIANTELLAISSNQGEDTIELTVFDTVNAMLFVNAGLPATTNPNGDILRVIAGSPSAHLQKQPGGPVTGSGTVFVTYPQTTDTTTRIDYEEVEVVRLIK